MRIKGFLCGIDVNDCEDCLLYDFYIKSGEFPYVNSTCSYDENKRCWNKPKKIHK